MSAKQLIALIWLRSNNGDRLYGVFDRDGNLIATKSVFDCGHGAAIAHKWAKERYNVSTAEWTYELARKVRNDPKYQEGI